MKQSNTPEALELPSGSLEEGPLVSPFFDFIGRLLRSPCRTTSRMAVSTRKYKGQVARAFVDEVGHGPS